MNLLKALMRSSNVKEINQLENKKFGLLGEIELTEKDNFRFWKKVIIKEIDDCWYWTGCLSGKGLSYGRFNVRGRIFNSSRVSLALSGINITENDLVLHSQTCTKNAILLLSNGSMSKQCCNPNHLRIGTHKENSRDTIETNMAKGLFDGSWYVHGETHPFAKLTTKDIENIRNDKRIQKLIAEEYCVDPSTISKIKTFKRRREG